MKTKRAVLWLTLLGAVCAFAFAAPPVYPGAKAMDELNAASKKAGQNAMAYSTPDSFEKVYEFYKKSGTEVHTSQKATEKNASFRYRDTGYGVTIVWKADSSVKGTTIHIGGPPGR
jgi:hypothetical protein